MVARGAQVVAAAVCAAFLFGCGHAAELRSSFPDNDTDQIRALLARIPAAAQATRPANESGRPMVVVALQGDQPGLAAFDASSGAELWRRPMEVSSTPVVGGPVVVVRSGDEVVGLGVGDGRELWSRRCETIDFMGAAIDSGVVVLTFSTAGQRASVFREARALALDAASGRVVWSIGPVERQFGAPAATGGVAFIPWDRLSLSAFDIATGEEVARLLSRDDVYSFVRAGPEGVFYGSTSVYRLGERSTTGRREEADVYEPLVANAPVTEGFFPDGFLGQSGERSARNKIRFLWHPAPAASGPVALSDDAVYFLYYRIVFAFDAATGAVRWVRLLDRDFEAATVVPGGALLLDEAGDLVSIDAATGAVVGRVRLGVPVATAAFDVPELPRGQAEEAPQASVREQLRTVVFDADARLTPVRRFAVAVLASMPEEEATLDLLRVCERRSLPVPVRDDAARVLRTRQAGSGLLIEALAQHHDFLENREAPPVGVIAAAVLNMRDQSAVPRLWEHFVDPETPREDLAPIAVVLNDLGSQAIVGGMRDYVVRYHADSEFRGAEGTLLELVRSIARYGTDQDREAVGRLMGDPATLRGLADGLREALVPPAPEAPASAGAPEAAGPVVPEQQIAQVMEGARARIRPCIQSALRRSPQLSEVRMRMTIGDTGDLESLAVEPADDILGSCLTLSIGQSRFPTARGVRHQAEYTIRIEH
jgi:outer membrane protein assembly factor BamB